MRHRLARIFKGIMHNYAPPRLASLNILRFVLRSARTSLITSLTISSFSSSRPTRRADPLELPAFCEGSKQRTFTTKPSNSSKEESCAFAHVLKFITTCHTHAINSFVTTVAERTTKEQPRSRARASGSSSICLYEKSALIPASQNLVANLHIQSVNQSAVSCRSEHLALAESMFCPMEHTKTSAAEFSARQNTERVS